jgi:hypothetical protein
MQKHNLLIQALGLFVLLGIPCWITTLFIIMDTKFTHGYFLAGSVMEALWLAFIFTALENKLFPKKEKT